MPFTATESAVAKGRKFELDVADRLKEENIECLHTG